MNIIFCILILMFCISVLGSLNKRSMTLERVVIVEQDPNHITAVTFTYRVKRGDSYKTNSTVNLVENWSNNVTVVIYYKNSQNNAEHVLIDLAVCDLLKLRWFIHLLAKYSDIPGKCPVSAGEYHVNNLELQHHNFPLILPSGQHYIGLIAKRRNNEVIIHYMGTIHIQQ